MYIEKNILFEPLGSRKWDTKSSEFFVVPIISGTSAQDILNLTIHSNKASMLFVDVLLTKSEYIGIQGRGSGASNTKDEYNGIQNISNQIKGYNTSFIVEWTGLNTIPLLAHTFNAIGNPESIDTMNMLVLFARGYTFPGTILEVVDGTLSLEIPLIKVNSGEYLLENFTSTRFWDRGKWLKLDINRLKSSEGGLSEDWFYATLWYVRKKGVHSGIGYTRDFSVNITRFQSLIVFASVDLLCLFSIEVVIDGVKRIVLDREAGKGEGIEYRMPICGSILQSVNFVIEDRSTAKILEDRQIVNTMLRWLMLECKGTDPKNANEVNGIDKIPEFEYIEDISAVELPVELLLGHKDLNMLREAQQSGNNVQRKIYTEIIDEANAQINYPFETFGGTYLPVWWGNQGVERASSPVEAMPRFYSAMVYGGIAYLLTGEIKYAVTARRALLTTVRCRHLAAGFVSRIPVGLPGYRAPFIESHASEAIALCYDFIYNILSPEERREIEDALYDKAIRWIDSFLRLNGEGYLLKSNQGAVYTAGFMFAALVARKSHPDVDDLIERNLKWFYRMLDNYYKHDGSTFEGPSYWQYTTQYASLTLILASRYFGKTPSELTPAHFKATIEYMCHLRSLSKKDLSFLPLGDCNYKGDFGSIGPAILFFSKYFGVDEASWLWEKFCNFANQPDGSFIEHLSVTGTLMTFLMSGGGISNTYNTYTQLPLRKMFPQSERIFLRTGQKHGDILLFFEGGSQTFEHSHFDKGQYILEAYGESLASDPGMIDYNRPDHVLYVKSTYHNIITIDGRDQTYKDTKRAVIIKEFTYNNELGYDYINADLSNSYKELKAYNRKILFIRPYYFLLIDEVESLEDGIEWNFHSKGTFCLDDAPDTVKVCATNAHMNMNFLSNAELNYNISVYKDKEEVVCNNLVLYPDKAVRKFNIATLMLPYPSIQQEQLQQCRVKSIKNEEGQFIFYVHGVWGRDKIIYEEKGHIEILRKQKNKVDICLTI
jgi:hypothetical protein